MQIQRSFRHVTSDHLWYIWLFGIFRHYSVTTLKKVFNMTRVFLFSWQHFLKVFYIQEEFSEILSKIHLGLNVSNPSFLSDCKQTWVFSMNFNMSFSIECYGKPSSGRRFISCVQTSWHEEANSQFLQLIHTPKTSAASSKTFAFVQYVGP
jgi:hypothetical protein